MRLEHFPILLGVLVGLMGIALIADAWLPEEVLHRRERRRRPRAERHHLGEALVGVGILCVAAALVGRDAWRWGTLFIILGFVLVGVGIALNREYLREVLFFRGAARRRPESDDQEVTHDHSLRDASRGPKNGDPGDPADTGEREPRLRIR